MKCDVTRAERAPVLDGKWNKQPWKSIKPETVADYMGTKPEHIPLVQFKTAYDDANIFVIFRVEDRYVRATQTQPQSYV